MPFHQLPNGHFLWFLISNIFPYPLFLQSAFLSQHSKHIHKNPRLAPYSNEHPFDIFVLSLKRRIFFVALNIRPSAYILSPSTRPFDRTDTASSPFARALPIGLPRSSSLTPTALLLDIQRLFSVVHRTVPPL